MISGLNHLTLSVRDVEQSFRFYVETLGARPLARWSRGAYLLAGDLWLCLSLDDRTRSGPLPEYSHIAFTVAVARFEAAEARIRSSGATIWQDDRSEGASLYFLDPDGHKLEIHAGDWRTRLAAMKEDPWEEDITYFDQ
jgi:catechol 2,3-dioxygenase-like lactoylglutathione lyase family enzyme